MRTERMIMAFLACAGLDIMIAVSCQVAKVMHVPNPPISITEAIVHLLILNVLWWLLIFQLGKDR